MPTRNKKKPKKIRPKPIKLVVKLTKKEREFLLAIVRRGSASARTITRARILLLSHKGKTNREIEDALDCSHDMIKLTRKHYHERSSVEEAITDAPRPGQPKKITPAHEAFVIATACTPAPPGHAHWTLPALRDTLVATYENLTSVSDERIRQILLRSALKPWREKNVVRPGSYA